MSFLPGTLNTIHLCSYDLECETLENIVVWSSDYTPCFSLGIIKSNNDVCIVINVIKSLQSVEIQVLTKYGIGFVNTEHLEFHEICCR